MIAPIWTKIHARGPWITKIKSETPKKGLWYQMERVEDSHGGQHTIERGALDGEVKLQIHAYCGEDRRKAWLAILKLRA